MDSSLRVMSPDSFVRVLARRLGRRLAEDVHADVLRARSSHRTGNKIAAGLGGLLAGSILRKICGRGGHLP